MSFDSPIVSAFANLTIIVGILVFILLLIKKFGKKLNGVENSNSVKIISKSSLSSKNHLYVIEIEDMKLLIGANDNSINLITDLKKSETNTNLESKSIANKNKKANNTVNSINPKNNLSFKSFIKSAISKH